MTTFSEATDTLYGLRAKRSAAERQLVQISDAIKATAYDASTGNADAVAKMAKLRSDKEAREREIFDLAAAIEAAEARLEAVKAEKSAAEEGQYRDEIRQIAKQYTAQSAQVDAALRMFANAMERRKELYEQLARSGVMDGDPTHLICETRLAIAFRKSGAQNFVPQLLGGTSGPGDKTLAGFDRETLAALLEPEKVAA